VLMGLLLTGGGGRCMDGAMRADRDRSPSRSAPQAKARWPTKIATRTSDGPPAGRLAERRQMQVPERCGHVMPLRSRSSASTDSTGATRIADDRRRCGRDARSELAGDGHEPANACP